MEMVTMQQIQAASSGDETALAAVIAQEMPVIRAAAARAQCRALDFDDAVQEGLIGLFSAINTYDDAQAQFVTYAASCINNAVITAQRAALRKKHAPLNNSVPLCEEHPAFGPEQQAEDAELLYGTLHSIRTRLSKYEQDVLRLHLQEYSYRQIAEALGKEVKSVDNAMQRIRAKLK